MVLWLVTNNSIAFTILLKLLWNVKLSLVLEYVVPYVVVIIRTKLKYFMDLLISRGIWLIKLFNYRISIRPFFPNLGFSDFLYVDRSCKGLLLLFLVNGGRSARLWVSQILYMMCHSHRMWEGKCGFLLKVGPIQRAIGTNWNWNTLFHADTYQDLILVLSSYVLHCLIFCGLTCHICGEKSLIDKRP